MSNAGKLIFVATAALAGGVAVAQTPGAAAGNPGRFDPFNAELWLNAPDSGPTTQPVLAPPTADNPKASGTGGGRPIIRDPLRPPTRSPFRP